MKDCIFCQIVAGDISSDKAYEDEFVVGFKNIDPQADTHLVFIPKSHIASLREVVEPELLGKVLLALRDTAKKLNIADYKVINNNGHYQHVPHIHFHLLGGTLKGGII